MLSNALFGRGSDKVNACPSTSHSGGVGIILHTNQRPVRAGFWKRHYDVSQVAIFVNHVQQLTLVPFLFRPGATLLCQYSLPRRERACQHQELRPQDYQQISAACSSTHEIAESARRTNEAGRSGSSTPGARHRRARDNQCSLSVLILCIVGWGALYCSPHATEANIDSLPSLLVAVVRTAVSNCMHRAPEAQADQSIARVRSREGF